MQKLTWKLRVWSGKALRLSLRAVFGFDRWHVFTLTEKQYAKDIISYSNGRLVRNAFAEIGCGLGDIVRHVRYLEREGYDMDVRALRAARFLSRVMGQRGIRFRVFSFPGSALPGRYDMLLLVNWIHHIEPAVLKAKIEEYFTDVLMDGGQIVIDTVQDPEYKFNHDIQYLTRDLPARIDKLGDYERQRQIWLIGKPGHGERRERAERGGTGRAGGAEGWAWGTEGAGGAEGTGRTGRDGGAKGAGP